jgi:23S rRNA (adenine2503-C2)-methyltransferase
MLEVQTTTNLFGLSSDELERLAMEYGEPRYRGQQIFHALYARRQQDLENLTNLSKSFRQQLASRFAVIYPRIRERLQSRDGSSRYLLELTDGQTVEAVHMPDQGRITLCISSQAGCAVDCRFCFTALMGLQRNLSAGEILGQVYAIAQDQRMDFPMRLNIVLMGMGEPLLNFAPVMKAIRVLTDPDGMRIPWRRITLSTSGIIPRIHDLAREPVRPKLAISLNASTDEQRTVLMPINRKYPLAELIAACRAYPLRPRELLTFEYVMLDGVNDSEIDALRVAKLLRGLRAKVNLIPYNSGSGLLFRTPPFQRVLEFQKILARQHIPAFIRISRGQDIGAACGQLRVERAATSAAHDPSG